MRRHRLDDVARPLTCHVVTSTAIVRPLGRCRCRARIIFRACFFGVENGRGGGSDITYLLNSDDDMRRHRLDDVARLLTCSVVAIVRLRLSVELLTWRVVVVGGGQTVAGGGGGDEAEGDDGG